MENLILLGVVVAVVLLTSLFKLPLFSAKAKLTIATVVSVIGAGVHVWLTGGLESTDIVQSALQVFGGSQLIYRFILDKSGFDAKLESVGVKKSYDAES